MAIIDRLESFAGQTLKEGRNTIKGFPCKLSGDGGSIDIDCVDRSAAVGLRRALSSAGFSVGPLTGNGFYINSIPYTNGRQKAEAYLNQKMTTAGIRLLNGLETEFDKGYRDGKRGNRKASTHPQYLQGYSRGKQDWENGN